MNDEFKEILINGRFPAQIRHSGNKKNEIVELISDSVVLILHKFCVFVNNFALLSTKTIFRFS